MSILMLVLRSTALIFLDIDKKFKISLKGDYFGKQDVGLTYIFISSDLRHYIHFHSNKILPLKTNGLTKKNIKLKTDLLIFRKYH